MSCGIIRFLGVAGIICICFVIISLKWHTIGQILGFHGIKSKDCAEMSQCWNTNPYNILRRLKIECKAHTWIENGVNICQCSVIGEPHYNKFPSCYQ